MQSSGFSFRSPILALAVGLAVFAVGSLLREAIQPHLENTPYVGALLTVAIFLLPGALVGGWSPRHTLMHGVILGILTAVFVTLQVGHFSRIDWTARSTLQVFGVFAGVGIILCEIGALGGRALARKWLSSNHRMERTGEG